MSDRLRLAVIGTFHQRYERDFALMHRLLVDSTRKPDEVFLMCEDEKDVREIMKAFKELESLNLIGSPPRPAPPYVELHLCPTPRTDEGRYAQIPYALKINEALNMTKADAIVYLDNNSMPGPYKFEVMAKALEDNPEWGAVYCTQKRTGYNETTSLAEGPVEDAFCVLNYTQVMHRLTADRWTLDMANANPDLADGLFWRSLHRTLGSFYPAGGHRIHDDHHIESPAAAGVT